MLENSFKSYNFHITNDFATLNTSDAVNSLMGRYRLASEVDKEAFFLYLLARFAVLRGKDDVLGKLGVINEPI